MAPATELEHACAHTYREDEGLQLEIDCIDCNGAHDLASRKCLAGVMNALVAASAPETIVLRRYTDKRYRGGVVETLCSSASALASLNRLLAVKNPPSDKRCRTCRASTSNVLQEVRRALLENPIAFLQRDPSLRRDIRDMMVASAGRCVDAEACVEESLEEIGVSPGAGT